MFLLSYLSLKCCDVKANHNYRQERGGSKKKSEQKRDREEELVHIYDFLVLNTYACLCSVAQSCLTLCDPMDGSPLGSPGHDDSPDKNTGVSCHFLLQGIFPTHGSNPGIPHCRQILYHLSHQGSPNILQWEAYPFSRGTSQPRNRTGSPIANGFFTS